MIEFISANPRMTAAVAIGIAFIFALATGGGCVCCEGDGHYPWPEDDGEIDENDGDK